MNEEGKEDLEPGISYFEYSANDRFFWLGKQARNRKSVMNNDGILIPVLKLKGRFFE